MTQVGAGWELARGAAYADRGMILLSGTEITELDNVQSHLGSLNMEESSLLATHRFCALSIFL